MNGQRRLIYSLIAVLALLSQWGLVRSVPVGSAQALAPNRNELLTANTNFLPLIIGGTGGGGAGNQTGAVWLPFTLQDGGVLPTYGASIAVDSLGGIHVVYSIYTGTDEQGGRPATYAHCSSQCENKANWTFTRLGNFVYDARIALDPNGKPRIILFGPFEDSTSERMRYQYAACDSSCSLSSSWTITTIVTPIEATATREYDNNRYFAIDQQGHPAFIYTDTTQNNHPGTFYVSCQANCTDAGQWIETTLSEGSLDKPSLSFSPDGKPRLAFGYFDPNLDLYLAYAQCDQNCSDGANWSGTTLIQIHGTTMFNLDVDTNGRPRLGVYSGSYSYEPFKAGTLYYLWCDSDCIASAGWIFTDIGLGSGTGDGVDLVLDPLNRPRMSFENAGQGLSYAWCNTNCESGGSIWQTQEVESKASLADNYEVLPIRRCTVSTWFNGQRSSLALDSTGNPRIAYDAQHWWYGTEMVGGVPATCNFKDVNVTRISIVNQP